MRRRWHFFATLGRCHHRHVLIGILVEIRFRRHSGHSTVDVDGADASVSVRLVIFEAVDVSIFLGTIGFRALD